MRIEIDALDTLFFRDGKPFTMGQETWADGIFPPPPSVIYGALRTVYFAQHIEEFGYLKKNGFLDTVKDATTALKIKGIFLEIENRIHFPLPLDMVRLRKRERKEKNREQREKTYKVIPLHLCDRQEQMEYGSSNLECLPSYLLSHNKEVEGLENGFISSPGLATYLSGDFQDITAEKLENYLYSEPKIGIGRENLTHTAADGLLYRVGMNRPKDLKIVVDFAGIEIPGEGLMKLGGEGKAVYYKQVKSIKGIDQLQISGKRFKLYFSTPTFFKQGWLPSWLDAHTLKGIYQGIPLKLSGAAVGKYTIISGFDMARNCPRAARRAVPAGSVYYFEIEKGSNMDEVLEAFNARAISEDVENNGKQSQPGNSRSAHQGFGISFVGGVL